MELLINSCGGVWKATELLFQKPWMGQEAPFKMLEQVYSVGNNFVSAYLLDTGDGLILIDTTLRETTYQLIDSIYRLGKNPHDIKYILLSHGHFDHTAGAGYLQKLTGAEVWMGQGDAYFYTERRDLIFFEDHTPEFQIDHFYDYSRPIVLGNKTIRPVHTPGHTPGTTSFFFDVQHNGKTYTCGIHGGLGLSGLSRRELEEVGKPVKETQNQYLEMLRGIQNRKVDVVLPSHATHGVDYPIFDLAQKDDGTGEIFIDPAAWKRMIVQKISAMEALIASGK